MPRSQGPLETEIVDGSEELQHIVTQRRLSRELQVRLETLRFTLHGAAKGKKLQCHPNSRQPQQSRDRLA